MNAKKMSRATKKNGARAGPERALVVEGDCLWAAKCAVIHIQTAFPNNASRVDGKGIPLVNMVVNGGGEEIVGRGDGVHVSCEMEVDILHGQNL